jgi:hypothetical protein
VAVSDNAQRLAADLEAVVRDLVPLAIVQLLVAVTKPPRQRDDLCNDELGCAVARPIIRLDVLFLIRLEVGRHRHRDIIHCWPLKKILVGHAAVVSQGHIRTYKACGHFTDPRYLHTDTAAIRVRGVEDRHLHNFAARQRMKKGLALVIGLLPD